MSVQEISTLHQRYVGLSQRFRAGWVYHQLLQSLVKVSEVSPQVSLGSDLKDLYTELREVSKGLTASPATQQRLDDLDRRLEILTAALIEEDTRVGPEVLRRFFQRFPQYDGKIQVQLSRFYVCAAIADGWQPDRVDKLDFLLTRIARGAGEESGAPFGGGRLREVLQSLWGLVREESPAEEVVAEMGDRCREIRGELAGISSLDQLNERALLPRFRAYKHELGPLLVAPEIGTVVLDTNLAFKDLVDRLYRREELRIAADYQQIFELESEVVVDTQLDQELTHFREEIERFESLLGRDEFKLQDLAQIRRRVRSLLPRLRSASQEREDFSLPEVDEKTVPEPMTAGELVSAEYRRILNAFESADPEMSPGHVASTPEIYPLRLEPREVIAYRRLAGQEAPGPGGRRLEQLLLEAAAIRVRLNAHAAELRESAAEATGGADGTLLEPARRTLRAADEALWRFQHQMHQLLLAGQGEEARHLEVLRMRLMRDYADAWLLVYRPFLGGLTGGF